MAYRNDHEAALARVDALERANAVLAHDNDRLRVAARLEASLQRRGQRHVAIAALASLGSLAVGVVLGIALAFGVLSAPQSGIADHEEALREPTSETLELDACVSAIGPAPIAHGAYRSWGDVEAAERTAAPCRSQLGDLTRAGQWSPAQSQALGLWRTTEDELGNRIAMVVEAKRADPLAEQSDEGVQLWREYDRALARRNAALLLWRRAR